MPGAGEWVQRDLIVIENTAILVAVAAVSAAVVLTVAAGFHLVLRRPAGGSAVLCSTT